jgi:hypothetical protein
MTVVLGLCANCDLRTGPAQCELSDQEVTALTVPHLTSADVRGRGAVLATQRRAAGKDSGGLQ